MRDNILLSFVAVEVLFVITGALLLIFALNMESEITQAPTIKTVAKNLLLMMCPLSGG
jgi:hypothetical protein